MRSRIDTWKRLVKLYTALEDMHATEMQNAVLNAQTVLQGAEVERDETTRASIESRSALISGNQLKARIFDSTKRSANWRRQRLETLYLMRKQLSDAAREQYLASRIRRNQVESVMTGHVEHAQADGKRNAQLLADDRYLARRIWQTNQVK